jgi:D-serine deaminase-like pyridoxal phosphate-dependent protein
LPERGLGPNGDLIGRPGSRTRLHTPALVLDLDAFEANLDRMAGKAREAGRALRPHAKSHKSIEIARRQIGAGARGVTCATLAEAETLAGGGIGGVLLSSPVVQPGMIARLARLNTSAEGLMVVVDHPAPAAALDRAAAAAGKPLEVLIDVDVGAGRTGVASLEDALALAGAIRQLASLRLAGIQAYYGQLQHIAAYAERAAAAAEQKRRISAAVDALRDAGIRPGIVSGSGTGTHHMDLADGPFSELQVGSYLFTDQDYRRIELEPGGGSPFRPSLFVAATVISVNQPGCTIVDAGLKALATDSGVPVPARGTAKGATYGFMGDEHGAIRAEPGTGLPPLGDVIELLTPHCDPTVNLHDHYHVVRGNELVAIWPVDARGH